MPLRYPDGIDTTAFLRDYWQRQPLLLPATLQPPTLDPNELAGLACEADIEARLIDGNAHRGWRLRHGPFTEADFAALPERDWTLLVQDVDKWLPTFADLLDDFRFLPDWRIDDIMISYAVDGGSVGPHVDSYDVFLLQLSGEREWLIEDRHRPDPPLRADSDPRVMRDFQADRQWRLRPGDILYLPPHLPHWGIARGDGCMTCSIGFRAPDGDELIAALGAWLAEHPRPVAPWSDPPLAAVTDPSALDSRVFSQLRERLTQALALNDDELYALFAQLLTEPKSGFTPHPPESLLPRDAFVARLRDGASLRRDPAARFTHYRNDRGGCTLWVAGEALDASAASAELPRLLATRATLDGPTLAAMLEHDADAELLYQLYRMGMHELHD